MGEQGEAEMGSYGVGFQPTIKNLLIMDGDGARIVSRYYTSDHANFAAEQTYEKNLFNKTSKSNARSEAEIILFNNAISVYRNLGDVWFYVTGEQDENELILIAVLSALTESLSSLLRNSVEKKSMMDNLDLVYLALD